MLAVFMVNFSFEQRDPRPLPQPHSISGPHCRSPSLGPGCDVCVGGRDLGLWPGFLSPQASNSARASAKRVYSVLTVGKETSAHHTLVRARALVSIDLQIGKVCLKGRRVASSQSPMRGAPAMRGARARQGARARTSACQAASVG